MTYVDGGGSRCDGAGRHLRDTAYIRDVPRVLRNEGRHAERCDDERRGDGGTAAAGQQPPVERPAPRLAGGRRRHGEFIGTRVVGGGRHERLLATRRVARRRAIRHVTGRRRVGERHALHLALLCDAHTRTSYFG